MTQKYTKSDLSAQIGSCKEAKQIPDLDVMPVGPGSRHSLPTAPPLAVPGPQGIAAATVSQVFLLGSMVAVGLALLLAAYSSRVYRDAKLLRPSSGRST